MTSPPLLPMNDGHTIPQLGFGVYKVPPAETAEAVTTALETGYRHIDTAALYENEQAVGEAVRASGIPREELFITTKVWNDRHGFEETQRAFDESAAKLGLDYVDLYLIHWPAPTQDRYVEAWRAFEKLRADGRVRSIGVSNFHTHHLDRLLTETDTTPVLNQVELHPWLPQTAVREYDANHGILTEAWAPLARGRVLGDQTLERIADKYGKTPAQVVIRWHLELGTVVIPKSVTPDRIRENFQVFDFSLDHDDLAQIADLENGERTGSDPDDS